jgi:hypothetical protein
MANTLARDATDPSGDRLRVMRVALALFEATRGEAELAREFRDWTASCWSKSVATSDFMGWCSKHGIDLPNLAVGYE